MSPRLGLVAYGTATGLGYQTRDLYRHLHPAKTLLLDLSDQKGLPLHREWFPDARVVRRTPSRPDMEWLTSSIDVVMVCETPIDYDLFTVARSRGVRTVLAPNPEFLEYGRDRWLPKPTVFAAPGPWLLDRMDTGRYPNVWPLPVPIDPTRIRQREITEARTFLHVAGRPAARDRNGTLDFIALAGRCQDLDARWVLACQSPTREITIALRGTRVELLRETPEPGDLYADGDVLILPRRYGGLSIPALEAVTAGMPVVMPDIQPNNLWLPPDWLIPAHPAGQFRAKVPVDLWQADMPALEALTRRLHSDPPTVTAWATDARQIAARWTWDALTPFYADFLERVLQLQP